jgi:hypothetical protein
MKAFNQTVERSQRIQSGEDVNQNKILAEKAEEKKKRLPEEMALSISLLIAQLPPETRELIKTYISQSEQNKSMPEDGFSKVDSTSNSTNAKNDIDTERASQLKSLKSSKGKTNADLDAMMLAALAPKLAVPQTYVTEDSGRPENESGSSLDLSRHKKPGSETGKHAAVESDVNNAKVRDLTRHENLTVLQSDIPPAQVTVPAQSVLNLPQQPLAVSADATQDRQVTPRLSTLQQKPRQINQNPENHNQIAAAAGTGTDKIGHKSKEEESADAGQSLQTPISPTTLHDVVFAQLPQQPQAQSAFQRSNGQEKANLLAKNKAESVEGIKYNFSSLGQDKSVQITGTTKSGYTLRPSDEQVQNILRKNKDDTLPVSIENAPGVSDRENDIAQLRIEAVSGNESGST